MIKKKTKSKKQKKIEYFAHWRSCLDCNNWSVKCKMCLVAQRFNGNGIFRHSYGVLSIVGRESIWSWFPTIYRNVTGEDYKNDGTYYKINERGRCPFFGMNEGSKELGQKSILDEVKRLGIKNKLKDISY